MRSPHTHTTTDNKEDVYAIESPYETIYYYYFHGNVGNRKTNIDVRYYFLLKATYLEDLEDY